MKTKPGCCTPVDRPATSITILFVAFTAGLALSGCATGPKTAMLTAEQKIVTTNYKWVYVTGSHIPIAVPTNPNAKALTNISPLSIISPEEIRRWGGPLH